jgi:hypothetical protein
VVERNYAFKHRRIAMYSFGEALEVVGYPEVGPETGQ